MKKLILISFMAILFAMSNIPVSAQDDVDDKIKGKTNDRVDQRTDEGIDKGLDAVENGVGSLFKKKDKSAKKEKAADTEQTEDKSASKKEEGSDNASVKQSAPQSLSSYSKFDFIPGDKVIFYEDFTQDALADFPALWNTNGSGEVTTTNLYPGNWFKMKPGSNFTPEVTIPLNENFTFECDLIFKDVPTSNSSESFEIRFISASPDWKVGDDIANGCFITIGRGSAAVVSFKDREEFFRSVDQYFNCEDMTTKLRISIWIQKQRIRLYVNEGKVLDLPRALPPGLTGNKLEFASNSYEGNNSLMTNVRIAYGAPDTRNKLLTTGKFVTYGITFDVNSDKIKPESYGTLKDIANVLKDNAAVKVKIIGHTDADGDAAKNLDLSKRRAQSVKNELNKSFGIDASRMETDGKGKTEPVAPNDTPANKAQNRRVEFIKM
jgi:OmpA-OmpF porin, OOP family